MSESSRDQQVHAILHAYLRAVDAGQTPDREDILRQHPEIAEELRGFFADQAKMDGLAKSLHRDHTLDGAITMPPSESVEAIVPFAREIGAEEVPQRLRYFGDYELQEEIARGGMGVVFKAKQVSPRAISSSSS